MKTSPLRIFAVVLASLVGVVFHAVAVNEPAGCVSPVISIQPQNATVCAGDPATFEVTISSESTLPLTFEWHRSSYGIAGPYQVNLPDSPNGPIYVIDQADAQLNNYRYYRVQVSNPCGVVISQPVQLVVVNPTSIAQQPQSQIIDENLQLTLGVAASGAEPLMYQWQKNQNSIWVDLTDGGSISGATSASMQISPIALSDAGNYRVVIDDSSSCAAVESAVAAVSVAPAIRIDAHPASQVITYGDSTVPFSVIASGGSPPLSYQWRKNGTDIIGATLSTYTLPAAPPVSESGSVYDVVVSDGVASPVTSAPATLTVNRAVLTFTANSTGRAYGASNPTLTYQPTPTGFVNGEDSTVFTGSPVLGTTAQRSSPVSGSPYPIIIMTGSLVAPNYSFNFVPGELEITKAALTVTADKQTKLSGDANPPLTGTISGLLNNDRITAAFSTTVDESTSPGLYPDSITATLLDPDDRLLNYIVSVDSAGDYGDFDVTTAGLVIDLPSNGDLDYVLGQPPTPLDRNASVLGTFADTYFHLKTITAKFNQGRTGDYLMVRDFRKDGKAFSDNFNRSDADSVGMNWSEIQGDLDIVSSALSLQSGANANNLIIYSGDSCDTPDQYVCVTVPQSSATGGDPLPYIVLRYTDASSPHYRVQFDRISGTVKWFYHANPAHIGDEIESQILTTEEGNKFGVTITGTGEDTEIRVWKNPMMNTPVSATQWDPDTNDNTEDIKFTDNPSSAVDSGNSVGLGGKVTQAGNVSFDTFFAGDIPDPTVGEAQAIEVATEENADGSYNLSYGGEVIGKVNGGALAEPLVITFEHNNHPNENVTEEMVEAVLQNICYINTSASPEEGTREVQMAMADSDNESIIISPTRYFSLNVTCPGPNALDVVLIIDKTTSMETLTTIPKDPPETGYMSRLEVAKAAAISFLDYLELSTPTSDRVQVLSFGGDPGTVYNPVQETPGFISQEAALVTAIEEIQVHTGTIYHPSLMLARSELTAVFDDQRSRLIIFLTDGQLINKSVNEPLVMEEVGRIKDLLIGLITIGIGEEIQSDTDTQSLLQAMASSPDLFWMPSDENPLTDLYGRVANSVCRETDVNQPPLLTETETLTGARENQDYLISYEMLMANSNARDPDGNPDAGPDDNPSTEEDNRYVHFRIMSVSSGTFQKAGQSISVGTEGTLIGPGESMIWIPPTDTHTVDGAPVNAFKALAWDEQVHSEHEAEVGVQFQVGVAPHNTPPVVDAGRDLSVPPDVPIPLAEFVDDPVSDLESLDVDLNIRWTRVSGPGVLSFAAKPAPGEGTYEPSDEKPMVVFAEPGRYVLRLTANDGEYTSSDEVEVNVADCASGNLPLDIIILYDVSASVSGWLPQEREAIENLVAQMRFTGGTDSDALAIGILGDSDTSPELVGAAIDSPESKAFLASNGRTAMPLLRDSAEIQLYLRDVGGCAEQGLACDSGYEDFEPLFAWAIDSLKQDLLKRKARPLIVFLSDFRISRFLDINFDPISLYDSSVLSGLGADADNAGIRVICIGEDSEWFNPYGLAEEIVSNAADNDDVDIYRLNQLNELIDLLPTLREDCGDFSRKAFVSTGNDIEVRSSDLPLTLTLTGRIAEYGYTIGFPVVANWVVEPAPGLDTPDDQPDVADPNWEVTLNAGAALGDYEFSLQAVVNGEVISSDSITITVTDSLQNKAPICMWERYEVDEDSPQMLLDVLANDRDPDALTGMDSDLYLTGFEIMAPNFASVDRFHGTVSISPDRRSLLYKPDANYNTDSPEIDGYAYRQVIRYTVTDRPPDQLGRPIAGSASATGLAMVYVRPVNDPPTAQDDYFVVPLAEFGPQETTTLNLTANDINVDGDEVGRLPEQNGLLLTSVSPLSPTRGILQLEGGPEPFVVFRLDPSDKSHYRVSFDVAEGKVRWISCSDFSDPGVVVDTASLAFVQGDQFGVTVTGAGAGTVVRVWRNPSSSAPAAANGWDASGDVADVEFTANPPAARDLGKRAGFGAHLTIVGNFTFDNFSAGEIGGSGVADEFTRLSWDEYTGGNLIVNWIRSDASLVAEKVQIDPYPGPLGYAYWANDLPSTSQYVSVRIPAAYDQQSITYTPEADEDYYEVQFSYTVMDSHGLQDTAEVTVRADLSPNWPPVAVSDVRTVWDGTTPTINVLQNDYDPNGDPLSVVWDIGSAPYFSTPVAGGYRFDPAPSGTPPPPALGIGTHVFSYQASDNLFLSDSATLTIEIISPGAPPIAEDFAVELPRGTSSALVDVLIHAEGDGLTVTSLTGPTHGTASIITDGPDAGKVSYSPAADPAPGYYGPDSFTYTVTDAGTRTATATVDVNVYDPASGADVTAELTKGIPTDEDELENLDIAGVNESFLFDAVRDGVLVVTGEASDTDSQNAFYYDLEVYPLDENLSVDYSTLVASYHGTDRVLAPAPPDAPQPLGTLDLRGVADGQFIVTLTVHSGNKTATDSMLINVQSSYKIGNLKFSETDATVNIGGYPITVTRSYDSIQSGSSRAGDYGPGWTFDLNDMDVQINETRENVQDGSETYSRRSGGGRDVSLTLPDGRRAVFAFKPRSGHFGLKLWAEWESVTPGVAASLSAGRPYSEYLTSVGYWHWYGNPQTAPHRYDIPQFLLATPDGIAFHLARDFEGAHDYSSEGHGSADFYVETYGKARLTQIDLPTGDRFYFNTETVRHQAPGQVGTTLALKIERDPETGFIKAVHDRHTIDTQTGRPIPNSDPVVTYEYEDGHLVRVNRLRDRDPSAGSNPGYDTTTYEYLDTIRPHLITGIIDPRGVRVAESLYDDQGRLERIEQPDGRWVEYHHDDPPSVGAVARERIVDSEGNTTIHDTDGRGNVVLSIDALGTETARTFDYYDNPESQVVRDESQNPILKSQHVMHYSTPGIIERRLSISGVDPAHTLQTLQEFDYEGRPTRLINARYAGSISDLSTSPDVDFAHEFVYDPTSRQPAEMWAITENSGAPVSAVKLSEKIYFDSPSQFAGLTWKSISISGETTEFDYYDGDPGNGRFGDLKTVTIKDSGGTSYRQVQYEYDANGNRTGEIRMQKSGEEWTAHSSSGYKLDAQGRMTESVDAEGGHSYMYYDAAGRVEMSKDRYGAETHYTYDAMGGLIETTYPDGTISRMAVFYEDDASEQARKLKHTVVEEPRLPDAPVEQIYGTLTRFDALGRPISTDRVSSLQIKLVDDGPVKKSAYVSSIRLNDQVAGTADHDSEIRYDAAGRTHMTRDATGKWVKYDYDDKGRRWRTKAYVDENGDDLPETLVTLYGFDENGNQSWVLDANQYEAVKTLLSDVDDPEAVASELSDPGSPHSDLLTRHKYDNFNRIIRTDSPTEGSPTEGSAIYTEALYDDAGRTWLQIDADRNATAYVYDPLGRLTHVVTDMDTSTAELPNQDPTSTDWDSIRQADSTVTRFEYDDYGRLQEQIDARGNITSYEYDLLGRRTKRTLPGTSPVPFSEWTYDHGMPLVTGAKANNVRYRDFVGRYVLTSHDINGREISRVPDGKDPLASPLPADLSPEASRGVTYTYTPAGRRESTSEGPDQPRATYYSYDGFGRLRVKQQGETDQNGAYIGPIDNLYYEYDPSGRVKTITARHDYDSYSAGSNWDVFDQDDLEEDDRPSGAHMEYTYDNRGRLQDVIGGTGDSASASYGYDSSGNLKTMSYGNDASFNYEYNIRNQLRYLKSEKTGLIASFDYDDFDSSDELSWPDARRLKHSGMRQGLAEIVDFNGQEHRRTLAYDNDNLNRLQAERIRLATGAGWPTTAHQFHNGWAEDTVPSSPESGDVLYDVTPGYADTTGYDAVGNRGSRTSSGVPGISTRAYGTYDERDQLSSTLASGTVSSTYDANGNTLQADLNADASWDQTQPDEYDFENRLIVAERSAGDITILYDGDGNRVKKIVDDGSVVTTTRYLVDDLNPTGYPQVIEEQDASGAATATYLYGLDLVCQARGGNISYYGYDGQGTARYLMNDSGTVTDTYDYDAFGVLASQRDLGTPSVNHYRYAGEQWDPDLGMYYLRARYYHPDVGRFWTMDTFEGSQTDPLSLHKYLYAHNNPANLVDPSGQFVGTLLELLIAPTIGHSLEAIYNGVVTGSGSALQASLFGSYAGKAMNEVLTGFILDETGIGLVLDLAGAIKDYFGPDEGSQEIAEYLEFIAHFDYAVLPLMVDDEDYAPTGIDDQPDPQCFVAGTLVHSLGGLIPIEDVRPGDLVWAYDLSVAGKVVRPVVRTFVHEREGWLTLRVSDESIQVTPEHPFFVLGKGWVRAENLSLGDALLGLDSEEEALVLDLQWHNESVIVYNFEVADVHNYFITEGCFLVHNRTWLKGYHHFITKGLGSRIPYRDRLLKAGSQANGPLKGLEHLEIHKALKDHLLERKHPSYIKGNGKPLHMFPSKGNKGELIRLKFSKPDRLRALSEFYRNYDGGKYWADFQRELKAIAKNPNLFK